jgi:flagellar hook assembly protein FlgD
MDLTADSSLQTVSAYNIPNPMKRKGTTFYFSTILPTEDVDFSDLSAAVDRVEFEIRVFNQSGKLVKIFPRALSGSTHWDGLDEWGQLLANGVYFYKITARQSQASLAGARPGYRTLSSKRNVLIISR